MKLSYCAFTQQRRQPSSNARAHYGEPGPFPTSRRGLALVCVGQAFNRLRTPEAFLDAIENKPWPIEETYPPETRFNLSLERSNARRYVRRLHEALPLAKELPPLAATLPDPKAPRMLRLNIGILERDTGRPDKAIEALTSLLGDCPDLERLDVLQSPAIA